MGRKAHHPEPAQRRQVETMVAYGIPEPDISRVLSIDPKTLRKHYRDELDLGAIKANAQVAGFLFNSARNGNVSAQIFWLKTRARWKETPTEHQHTGALSTLDVRQLSDDQLAQMIANIEATLPPEVRSARQKVLGPALQAAVVTSTLPGDPP